MIAKYYKAPSKQAFDDALPDTFRNEEGNILTAGICDGKQVDIDHIGTIYNKDGVVGDDGDYITPPTAMEGWFVNVYYSEESQDIGGISEWEIQVDSPNRKIFE